MNQIEKNPKEKKDYLIQIDNKKSLIASALLASILATMAKYESTSESDKSPSDIQLGEISKSGVVQRVEESMHPEVQSDQILKNMVIKIDNKQEKVPEGWNKNISEIQTDTLLTFQTAGLKKDNLIRQSTEELLSIGEDLTAKQRSNYLKEVKKEYEKKIISKCFKRRKRYYSIIMAFV